MNNGHNDQTGVSSDAGRAKEEETWELSMLTYPFSMKHVPMFRFLCWGPDCFIIRVDDLKEKKGSVISQATFRNGPYGEYMDVTPEHLGHEALCRLLQKSGVGGRYKKWLNAMDEKDEELAREYEDLAYIRFSLELTDAKEEDWDIDTTIKDGGKE